MAIVTAVAACPAHLEAEVVRAVTIMVLALAASGQEGVEAAEYTCECHCCWVFLLACKGAESLRVPEFFQKRVVVRLRIRSRLANQTDKSLITFHRNASSIEIGSETTISADGTTGSMNTASSSSGYIFCGGILPRRAAYAY